VRLLDRLHVLFPQASRTARRRWLSGGRVRVDGVLVRRGDVEVGADARVTLGAPAATFPRALRLVHEDDALLVVDKPPGLLTIATDQERERTAYRMLRAYVAAQPGHRRLFVVHRLDRETSGLLVFAKSAEVKQALQAQFAARAVERVYVAVVEGRVARDAGVLRARVDVDPRTLRVRVSPRGREAVTRFRVLERRARSTVLELALETGRRGQIRAQLAALGHPVVGDRVFGSARDPVGRVCLHATRLGFVDGTGRARTFTSPVPAVFRRV
jgi:23S rRNA pseudouridine1911/1915/1917 synthase